MKKKIVISKDVLIDCNTCSRSLEIKGQLYCGTKIKDPSNVEKETITITAKNCSMFKIKDAIKDKV